MTDANPYSAPSSNLERPVAGALRPGGPRAVAMDRGWGWIAEGFEYFKRSPGPWILTVIVALVIYVVLALIPLIGQLAISITSYVWIAGYLLGCRAQDNGKPFAVSYLFEGFRNPGKLILLSVIMTAATFVIAFVAVMPVAISAFSSANDVTVESLAISPLLLLLMLVGFLVFIPLAMAAWFAPALIALHDVAIGDALKLSFNGCLKNLLPLLLYSIVALLMCLIGAIPFGLGLLVVFPVLTASMYVSYKDIFVEPA